MPIDFSTLAGDGGASARHPRDIFNALPEKKTRFEYPRDVQAEVWSQWFERREEHDLTLKMNTGSGKMAVGLLILQSCLRDGIHPCVYVAPTPQLAAQVVAEASDLGIATTKDPRSVRFLAGQETLVTSIHKLFNGKSVFGVGAQGVLIPIGAVVIDDAHACLEACEDKFAIRLKSGTDAYGAILESFREDLRKQSFAAVADLENGDRSPNVLVPFWVWQSKIRSVYATLSAAQNDNDLQFAWPLLRHHLAQCQCVVSATEAEIAPRCLPISMVPSFARAKRRVFMSATVSDDSVLVTHFDADPDSIAHPIVPASAGDIGDRLILVAQLLNPKLDDVTLKKYFASIAKTRNVVVLVPSEFRSEFWSDVAAETLRAANLVEGVERLKTGHVGLVVLVNKYDGVDLPKKACEVLVLDGLPDVRSRLDKIEQVMLQDSEIWVRRCIQRLEQGMGRGIRSKDDWCAVFLVGRTLTAQLYARSAAAHFTAATRAQLDLSQQLSKRLGTPSLDEIDEVVQRFLHRDKEWVAASRAAVAEARYQTDARISPISIAQRSAFDAAASGDDVAAARALQRAVDAESSDEVRGWLMLQLAERTNPTNAAEAQQILRQAKRINNQVPRPLDGIAYVPLPGAASNQATEALEYLRKRFAESAALLLHAHDMAEALAFIPETAERFEKALMLAGRMVGLKAHRPEKESGRGPDVLWSLGSERFAVIEAKNGATTRSISKHDCNQLNGSVVWFRDAYGPTCAATPVLVHPAVVPEAAATLVEGTRVMVRVGLERFRDEVLAFATAVASLPRYGTEKEVTRLLIHHKLTSSTIVEHFSEAARSRK